MNAEERLNILRKRHSVRSYKKETLPKEITETLKAEATMTTSFVPGLRFELYFNNYDPFKGFFKSYGTFSNPSNYLVAIVDEGYENIREKAGYYAEKFVIKCTELGIGTCFVGGTYDSSSVPSHLKAGEKVLFVVLFGIESDTVRWNEKLLVGIVHRKKIPVDQFFIPTEEYLTEYSRIPGLETGVSAVACAPSSLNKRPVRIFVKEMDGKSVVCAKVDESNRKNLIDLGIAKFNYNYATDTECMWGNGAALTDGEV